MLDVAGLYLATGDLDACQHQLMTLLKNDKENDDATIVSTVFWKLDVTIRKCYYFRINVSVLHN